MQKQDVLGVAKSINLEYPYHCITPNTVQPVSSFTSLDSTASLQTNNHIFPFLIKSNFVKLENSNTVILPPLWLVFSVSSIKNVAVPIA